MIAMTELTTPAQAFAQTQTARRAGLAVIAPSVPTTAHAGNRAAPATRPTVRRWLVTCALAAGLLVGGVHSGLVPAAATAVGHEISVTGQRLGDWVDIAVSGLSNPYAFSRPVPAGFGR